MTGRERMLVGVTLAAALCGGVAYGAARLVAARDAADAAATDLADCRRLAGTIESRRGTSPTGMRSKAAHDGDAGAEVTRRIESAAKSAGLPAGGIERIEPAPVRPVENGTAGGRDASSEKPTIVQLRGVTLRQTLTFFHAVAGTGRSPLRLSQLRLTAASADDAHDRWAIESTLTYPVHSETVATSAGDASMTADGAGQSETEE
jgi:hypothetical protein